MRLTHLGVLVLLASNCAVAAEDSNHWEQIAHSTYEKIENDGSTTRMSYGAEGANYDRSVLENTAKALHNRLASESSSIDEANALADTLHALEGIPTYSAQARPQSSVSNKVCGFNYIFDSHLIVGQAGATAIARANAYMPSFVLPPPFTSSTTYTTATITPAVGAAITRTSSASPSVVGYGNHEVFADADYTTYDFTGGYPFASGSCSASTFAYIQLSGGTCGSTPGYVSQTRTYPSCVTSP